MQSNEIASINPATGDEIGRVSISSADDVRAAVDRNLPIACVCHGIEILTAAGVIGGRTATTVAKCKLDVEQGGATYVDREVVLDGPFVFARTWHDNAPLMREFLRMLGGTA